MLVRHRRARAWRLVVLVATAVGAMGAVPACADGDATPGGPISAALSRLRASGGFQVELHGYLVLSGAKLTELSGTGTYIDDSHYRFVAHATVSGATAELKVIRLGVRQWEWAADAPGWRAVSPRPDLVTGSFAGLLGALGKVRDVRAGDAKECDGVHCSAWAFALPPGVATLQGLAIEGTGVVYVGEGDGLPREFRIQVRTPVGATGETSARMSGFGAPVAIDPPGLGGAPVGAGGTLTAAALEEALSAKDTVVISLTATGEGFLPPLPDDLSIGPLTLEAYIAPSARQVVATLRSAGAPIAQFIVTDGYQMGYFLPPGQRRAAGGGRAAPPPLWNIQRWAGDGVAPGPPAPPVPWALHTQMVRDLLRSATLEGPKAADAGLYSLVIPATGWSAGIAVPFVLHGTLPAGRQVSGQVRVDPRDFSPVEITIRAAGVTQAGSRLSAQEVYSFAYEATPEQRAAYSETLQWAEREAPRRFALQEQLPVIALKVAGGVAGAFGNRAQGDEAVRAGLDNPQVGGVALLSDSGRILVQAGALDAKAVDEFRQSPRVKALGPGQTAFEWREATLYCASVVSSPRGHRLIVVIVSKGEVAEGAPGAGP